MITTVDAELLVLGPKSSQTLADFVVPAEDIIAASIREMAGREIARGTILLNNENGKYTISPNRIDIDDELVFRAAWEGGDVGEPFGVGPFGDVPFGTSTWNIDATLIVEDWKPTRQRHNSRLALEVENYVFNRLSAVDVRYSEEDTQLSGSEDAVLDTILADFFPDVGTSLLPTITETVDYSVDNKPGNQVVKELSTLARIATGDPWIVGSNNKELTFENVSDIAARWTATINEFTGLEHQSDSDDMVNEVRVEGGIDDVANIDEQQMTGGTFVTVTDTNRITYQLTPRKPQITKVHLWLRHVAGSDDQLRIRLQSDDGLGNPVDINDPDSDIVSKRATIEDGFDDELHMRFGQHILGPSDLPWLIIEATGSDGVEVETDGAGTPKFHTHFSKPVIVRVPDIGSQDMYRVHDTTIEDDGLVTFVSARDRARSELHVRAVPKLALTGNAETKRAHELSVADCIEVDYDWLRADGRYVVTSLEHNYVGSTLESSFEMKSTENFA